MVDSLVEKGKRAGILFFSSFFIVVVVSIPYHSGCNSHTLRSDAIPLSFLRVVVFLFTENCHCASSVRYSEGFTERNCTRIQGWEEEDG